MKRHLPLFEQRILLFSICVISLCGIIYELVLGSLATYLFGNPVQQYSITIGVFLSSMGLGSYFSRFVEKNLIRNFVTIEVLLSMIGGFSVLILQYLFSFDFSFYLLHLFFLLVIGMLVGLEVPLMMRILRRYGSLREIVSNVLTLDYIGGLAGSLLFPLLLFPFVGRFLTSILIGIINGGVALGIVWGVAYPGKRKVDIISPIAVILLLVGAAFYSEELHRMLQRRLYYDDIVFSKRSRFQEIVLTRSGSDFRLYLDGSIQFSTSDEYRYHEMLVFPAIALSRHADLSVLVLGGGDGLAVRELLKSERIRRVVLVELDPEIVSLATDNPSLRNINGDALSQKRVTVIIDDAYQFLIRNRTRYNIIIADFPDPHDETISKLYTVEFYRLIDRSLCRDGIFVTQSTSPLFAREAFWCVHHTMKRVFPSVIPYRVYVPSFGEWGFNMASHLRMDAGVWKKMRRENIDFRFFSPETFASAVHFPDDCTKIDTRINTFNTPVLYTYYLRGWQDMDF